MFYTKKSSATFLLSLSVYAATHFTTAFAQDIEQEFDVNPGGELIVNSDAGAIVVNTWDSNTVRVNVNDPDGFDVRIDQRGNDVVVIAEYESRGLFRSIRSNIDFEIMVPSEFDVELDTGGGRIEVADLTGNVEVDTSGGRIEIGMITGGDVIADTSGGRIEIAGVDGDVEADTSGGSITIGDVSGDVSADTSGGDIRIGNVQGDMMADTSGGSIEVGEGGGRVYLETSGGTIRADWAIGALEADTSGGNIYLEGSQTSVDANTSGGNIVIERSDGEVRADTSGGSITIRKSAGPIHADTSGGRIDVEVVTLSGSQGESVDLESSGGDVTVRIPGSMAATIEADLEVSRRGRGDYRIYTDFPLRINEDDDGNIVGSGDINGGGRTIYLETTNSDIHIVSVND